MADSKPVIEQALANALHCLGYECLTVAQSEAVIQFTRSRIDVLLAPNCYSHDYFSNRDITNFVAISVQSVSLLTSNNY